MKYIQIPDDGVIEKNIMNGEDLIGVCRIDLSYLPAEDVVPAVHGKWIEQHFGTLIPVEYDDNGNVIVHDCINYQCSLCGRTESKKEPYCNCGAKMDGE